MKVKSESEVAQSCPLPYVKQIASGNLLYDSGNANQGSVTTERGGMERLKRGDICICMVDSC